MLFPGGAPAGVVDGREKVLLAAGVAAGVEPMGCVKTTGGSGMGKGTTHQLWYRSQTKAQKTSLQGLG
jgi:hypothetical protein